MTNFPHFGEFTDQEALVEGLVGSVPTVLLTITELGKGQQPKIETVIDFLFLVKDKSTSSFK